MPTLGLKEVWLQSDRQQLAANQWREELWERKQMIQSESKYNTKREKIMTAGVLAFFLLNMYGIYLF